MHEVHELKSRHPKLYHALEILPGALSSLLILAMITGGARFIISDQSSHPIALMAFLLIMMYYIWWLVRGFEYALFTILAVFKLKQEQKIDYASILAGQKQSTALTQIRKNALHHIQDMHVDDIIHRLILPTYNESYEILVETVQNLAKSNYNHKKLALTIAGEKRKESEFVPKVEKLLSIYGDTFGYISYTVHPLDPETEFPGKGANITYAARQEYEKVLTHFDTDPSHICVTTLDADSNVDREYFNHMSYTYIVTPGRGRKAYQPMIFFFNNFREAPFFSKVVSLCNSFWIMFNAMKKYGTRNFSTHMQPLDGLLETNFWSTETIVEDGHQFWRSYFAMEGDYSCLPVYTEVYQDCNQNDTLRETAQAQYKQMRRWSHGAEDIAYSITAAIENKKHDDIKIPFWRHVYEIGRLIEGVVLRSTLHLVLFGGIALTFVQDRQASSRLSLGGFVSVAMRIAYIVMIIVILLQLIFCPRGKIPGSKRNKLKELGWFILLYIPLIGPILVIFSGIPAFHTQLGLAFGRPMNTFNVTKKVRK